MSSVKVISANGFEWELDLTIEQKPIEKLLRDVARMETVLMEQGYNPAVNSVTADSGANNGLTFEAVELIPDVLKGVVYWNVTGPRPYHLHGVRVWPETLRAAGLPAPGADPEQIKNAEKVALTGWTAICEMRPKTTEEGEKPVVVKLVPPVSQTAPAPTPPTPAAPAPETKPDLPPPAMVGQTTRRPAPAGPITNPAALVTAVNPYRQDLNDPRAVYKALGGWPDFSDPGSVQEAFDKLVKGVAA